VRVELSIAGGQLIASEMEAGDEGEAKRGYKTTFGEKRMILTAD